jgi:TRAP-type uncharacterized transport system fused permease subunit
LGALRKDDRLSIRKLVSVLESTGRGLLDITIICGVAGFVIGALQLSGLGFKLSMGLVTLAGGNVIFLLVLSALLSIILGMGMPTVGVYILLAVLVTPALIEMGINPLAAHFFVFYYGMLAYITPPICFATYVAASIAKADFLRTGLTGMRLGIVAYLLPFLFVFSPSLLLHGSALEIVFATATAIIGAGLLGVSLTGYMFRPLNWLKRSGLAAAALAMIIPGTGHGFLFHWSTDLLGLCTALAMITFEWVFNRTDISSGGKHDYS